MTCFFSLIQYSPVSEVGYVTLTGKYTHYRILQYKVIWKLEQTGGDSKCVLIKDYNEIKLELKHSKDLPGLV